jgi:flagellar biosynthesis/type III secretory pathway chaperone
MTLYIDAEHGLDELLDKQIACIHSLRGIVQSEYRAIVHNDLGQLEGINQEKARVQEELHALEKDLQSILPRISAQYGIAASPMRLGNICDAAPEPYKTRFLLKKQELQYAVRAITRAHEVNRQIMQRSLDFQERSFKLMLEMGSEKVRYEAGGAMCRARKQLVNSVA